VIEGFFAIEQYVPDYTSKIVQLVRGSHGRSNFQLRWGSEEEKHADLWRNALLFSRFRTPQWIEDYAQALRNREWRLPWDDALHMNAYVVIQERATQVSYLNTLRIARGENPDLPNDTDPVLALASQTIAVDEAAHFNFFLETFRLFMYYYPAKAIEALLDVLKHFAMPGVDLVPNQPHFYEMIYKAGVYGPRQQAGDIMQIALENLDIKSRRALEAGLRKFREAPDADGHPRETAFFDALDYKALEANVRRLFDRIAQYEKETGRAELDPTVFAPSGLA
jgi:acyl-[acyl-carrier-protein] desaturase